MKKILITIALTISAVLYTGCSKVSEAEKSNASFVAHKLDLDGNVVESSTTSLTVPMVIKTISGIDQKVAQVAFEFTGSADHVSIWTGDSVKVLVPKKVDGITLEPTEWEYKVAACDYERYLDDDYSQKGVPLTGEKLSYRYWKAGTYKVYCVATNSDEYASQELNRDTRSITITVTE